MQQLNLSLYIFRTVILAPGVPERPLKCTMIIYKLYRKHFYTQYKSLLDRKLHPLRNLWKQLYKNINIFIFTGCQSFIPWQLMSEKALQIIDAMVADKKYILWLKYCFYFPGKDCSLWLAFSLHPVQVTVNKTFKHLEAGFIWVIIQPHKFLFWLVSG